MATPGGPSRFYVGGVWGTGADIVAKFCPPEAPWLARKCAAKFGPPVLDVKKRGQRSTYFTLTTAI